jgi:hypothetical protein
MSAFCPCCGKPAAGCGVGLGGALLLGGVTAAGGQVWLLIKQRLLLNKEKSLEKI